MDGTLYYGAYRRGMNNISIIVSFDVRLETFRMWVVEDAEKEEWSMTTFHLPQSAAGLDYDIIGTFNTGDICLLPKR
ncbi:unnamed protein product [Arabidopsis halleri]